MRFTIDSLASGTARLEGDDEAMVSVPRWLLPASAREGDALRIERTAGGADRMTIVVTVDAAEGAARRERSARTVARATRVSRRQDPGGDVTL